MRPRIKREFRQITAPAKFLGFAKKVKHALTDNPNIPESVKPLRQQLSDKVDNLETTYHLALDGSRTIIREREKLTEEIKVLLDQIAGVLEATFILDPNALLTTGFTIAQERRNHIRTKTPLVSPPDFRVANAGEMGRALASASTFPGVLVSEIHINMKDPSIEEEWFHKAIFPDTNNMVMENLRPGNTFFRMRHHGPDGSGPWSAVVSTTIT